MPWWGVLLTVVGSIIGVVVVGAACVLAGIGWHFVRDIENR